MSKSRRTLRYTASNHGRLALNSAHQLAATHALVHYQSGAIYSFIPKNACSTLRLSLAIANGAIRDINDFNWIHLNNDAFRATTSEVLATGYAFVVLRCPFRRIASAYLDKIVGMTVDAWSFHTLTGRRHNLLELSFGDYVRSLQDGSVLHGNIHWRPQTDFLLYDDYDEYFCLEGFGDVASALRSRISLEVVDSRPVANHGLDGLSLTRESNASRLTVFEIMSMKREGFCPAPESLFDDELRSIVQRLYVRDLDTYVEIFGSGRLLFS